MSESDQSSKTKVEALLRGSREDWKEIAQRVSEISLRDLPLENPRRIILFGVGSSYHVARLCAYALIRDKLRIRIPVVSCPSTAIGVEVHPQKGDWAFAFTHRGRTTSTTQALTICENSGAYTLQVSGKDAHVSESADQFLGTVPIEPVEPHTASVTGAICAVTSLMLGQKAIEEWDALRSIPEPDLNQLRKRAGTGPDLILGEWEGEWLAFEGALKIMEMAQIPVRAMSSDTFFHGPKFSVTKGKTKIWHIAVPRDPRTEQLVEYSPEITIPIYGASPLAWVPALVELQWLALAVALNRGVNPDLT